MSWCRACARPMPDGRELCDRCFAYALVRAVRVMVGRRRGFEDEREANAPEAR